MHPLHPGADAGGLDPSKCKKKHAVEPKRRCTRCDDEVPGVVQEAGTSGQTDAADAEASPLLAAAGSEAMRERPVTAADLPVNGVKEKATFGPKKFRPKRLVLLCWSKQCNVQTPCCLLAGKRQHMDSDHHAQSAVWNSY